MRYLTVVAAFLLSTAAALAGDPVGTYRVEGSNPGGGAPYKGTVTVERTGKTYRVIWVVAGTRYVGTGLGDKDFLAVSYKSGNDTGLALYGAKGDDWNGIWTNSGGREVGAEVWRRE